MISIEKLRKLVQQVCPDVDFDHSESLIDQIDSLDLVLLVDEVESEVGIKFQPIDINEKHFSTIETLHALIVGYNNEI